MGHSVVDVDEIPYTWGTFKFVRHHLGVTAFGFAQIDFPPGKVGSEHDETGSGQEEVYLALAGSGSLEVDGETVEMKPGRYVLVPPQAKRRPGHERPGSMPTTGKCERPPRSAPNILRRPLNRFESSTPWQSQTSKLSSFTLRPR